MLEWVRSHAWWLVAISAVAFVASLVLLPLLVVRMRPDYFTRNKRAPDSFRGHHPFLRAVLVAGKNALGLLLVLAGIAMLVLPGQGVLTILIGLTLVGFPGKRRLELWLFRQPTVRRVVNWMRRRADQPPLELPEPRRSRLGRRSAETQKG